jgi:uncharacterized membrane protein
MALANRWRALALGCCVALVAVVTAWQMTPIPTTRGALRALLLLLPALAPAIGLWRGSRYTYRWATLCVMPYFVVGLTEVVANPAARAWSAALLGVSLGWFVSLIAFLRVTKTVAP